MLMYPLRGVTFGGDSKRSDVTLFFLNSRRGIAPVKPFTQEGQV